MSHIVVLGAGLGGTIMAYEMRDKLRSDDRLSVVTLGTSYSFVPSYPWVAVGWRERDDVTVDLADTFKRRGIALRPEGAKKVHPKENRIELNDGSFVDYDYLVIATGPDLAFDEVPGLGPSGHTQSICHIDHAEQAARKWAEFVESPGPIVVGAVQGASCYGPAYEYAMIMDADLRRRKIRDRVAMTFVTAEPYVGHLGLGGVGDSKGMLESPMREHDIKWICNAKTTRIEADKIFVTECDDLGQERRRHELLHGEPIARELHREHGHRHADRDLVEAELEHAGRADAQIAGQHDERAGRDRVAGARDYERHLRAVERQQHLTAVGDEADHLLEAARHHAQIEPARERLGPAGEHHRRRFAFGAPERVHDAVDHLVRERVRLAVVHGDDGGRSVEGVGDRLGHPRNLPRRAV